MEHGPAGWVCIGQSTVKRLRAAAFCMCIRSVLILTAFRYINMRNCLSIVVMYSVKRPGGCQGVFMEERVNKENENF